MRTRRINWDEVSALSGGSISMNEAARRLGIHPSSCWYITQHLGLQWARPRRRWTSDDTTLLRELATTGCAKTEAARRLGRSYESLRKYQAVLGIRFKNGKPRSVDWGRAKELAESGIWLGEASRILGVHHSTCLYISRKMGFRWPKCPEGIYRGPNRTYRPRAVPAKKTVVNKNPERERIKSERIERMMQLARRVA